MFLIRSLFLVKERIHRQARRLATHLLESSVALVLLFCLALGGATLPLAHSAFYLHGLENHLVSEGTFHFEPLVSYYQSSANYDGEGVLFIPTQFVETSRFNGDFNLSYGLGPVTAFGRLNWTRTEVIVNSATGDSFGLGDQAIGLSIPFFRSQGGVRLLGQVQVDFPGYSNTDAQLANRPYLGDGSTDFTGSLFLTIPIEASRTLFELQGGVGYTYRTEGFSQAIPWHLSFRLKEGLFGLIFRLAILGVQSLETDSSNPYNSPTPSTTGAGGSYTVGAINPSLISARGEVGFRFSSETSIQIFVAKSVAGSFAPEGIQAGMGLAFDFGGSSDSSEVPSRKRKRSEYKGSNRGFIAYAKKSKIVAVNDRLNLVRISLGRNDGIRKGMIFDIFSVKTDGSIDQAVARAKVTDVKFKEAVLKVVEYYKEVWIEKGFVAQTPLE